MRKKKRKKKKIDMVYAERLHGSTPEKNPIPNSFRLSFIYSISTILELVAHMEGD